MNSQDILHLAGEHLSELSGHVFDVLTLSKPVSPAAATNLAKVISKLSPILGNIIEFNTVEFLNDQETFNGYGHWLRQDPGFPDTIFESPTIQPTPGLEIKAWFPLATEITARFRDNQNHFLDDQTYVVMLSWLPEHIIYGRPYILDVCVVSGRSVAEARDNHYHNPPDYIVLEPEDTSDRTRNLQQTNTAGYKFQGSNEEFRKAERLVRSWGDDAFSYKPTAEYQARLRYLMAKYKYRLDTNFAKMDRIFHREIEDFERKVYETNVVGVTIGEWNRPLASRNDTRIHQALKTHLNITEEDAEDLLR